jgi:hypothetical protein
LCVFGENLARLDDANRFGGLHVQSGVFGFVWVCVHHQMPQFMRQRQTPPRFWKIFIQGVRRAGVGGLPLAQGLLSAKL